MKKTKAKSSQPAAAPGGPPSTTPPRADIPPALSLKMAKPFKLIGYYCHPGAGPAIAMVWVEQDSNDPAQFITVEVKDHEKGTCVLPHNFGADQFEDARADFLRRTMIEVVFGRRR